MSDVFARVGGATNSKTNPVETGYMVKISSSNVIIDHTWLWRADHDIAGLVTNSANPTDGALRVDGEHVIAYGLFAEHTLKTLVQWFGNYGRTYFMQSELPYDVTQQNFGTQTGYEVGP